jgi:hypothetical protein
MAKDQKDDSVRKHVLYLLREGGAHMSFEDFVGSFSGGFVQSKD